LKRATKGKVTRLPRNREKNYIKKKLFFRTGMVLILFLALVLGFYSYRLHLLNRERAEVEEELSEYRRKEEELQEQIEQWKQEDFIEKKARQELGLVKPGETMIIMEE